MYLSSLVFLEATLLKCNLENPTKRKQTYRLCLFILVHKTERSTCSESRIQICGSRKRPSVGKTFEREARQKCKALVANMNNICLTSRAEGIRSVYSDARWSELRRSSHTKKTNLDSIARLGNTKMYVCTIFLISISYYRKEAQKTGEIWHSSFVASARRCLNSTGGDAQKLLF